MLQEIYDYVCSIQLGPISAIVSHGLAILFTLLLYKQKKDLIAEGNRLRGYLDDKRIAILQAKDAVEHIRKHRTRDRNEDLIQITTTNLLCLLDIVDHRTGDKPTTFDKQLEATTVVIHNTSGEIEELFKHRMLAALNGETKCGRLLFN